jgi:hypothetical protein
LDKAIADAWVRAMADLSNAGSGVTKWGRADFKDATADIEIGAGRIGIKTSPSSSGS